MSDAQASTSSYGAAQPRPQTTRRAAVAPGARFQRLRGSPWSSGGRVQRVEGARSPSRERLQRLKGRSGPSARPLHGVNRAGGTSGVRLQRLKAVTERSGGRVHALKAVAGQGGALRRPGRGPAGGAGRRYRACGRRRRGSGGASAGGRGMRDATQAATAPPVPVASTAYDGTVGDRGDDASGAVVPSRAAMTRGSRSPSAGPAWSRAGGSRDRPVRASGSKERLRCAGAGGRQPTTSDAASPGTRGGAKRLRSTRPCTGARPAFARRGPNGARVSTEPGHESPPFAEPRSGGSSASRRRVGLQRVADSDRVGQGSARARPPREKGAVLRRPSSRQQSGRRCRRPPPACRQFGAGPDVCA
jgi:hypothetical protein